MEDFPQREMQILRATIAHLEFVPMCWGENVSLPGRKADDTYEGQLYHDNTDCMGTIIYINCVISHSVVFSPIDCISGCCFPLIGYAHNHVVYPF